MNPALLAVSLLGVLTYLALLFRAGCGGDMKGAAYGDPARALGLESLSLIPLAAGLFAGAAAIARVRGATLAQRLVAALAFILAGGIALWGAGIGVEEWGTQVCFSRLQQ